MFQINVVEKTKIQHFMFNSFSENCAVNEIMSKNIVKPERPQITSEYGAYELHAG
jgi:hypothetical protein